MITLLSIIALGFFLGMRHATDPDHVIAVSTIVVRHRSMRHAAVIGALWGIGHTITILLIGSGIILFGWVVPVRLGLSMEFSVGLMLILLGVLNLTGFLEWMATTLLPSDHCGQLHGTALHSHADAHGQCADTNDPVPAALGWFDRYLGRVGSYHVIRPLVVGLVHGLAGSAAVALLVLATIQDPKWASVYLLVFGLGTIAGMMLITGALALPFALLGEQFKRLNSGLRIISGLTSVAFGVFLVYQIGFVNGLLTAHPQWTPR